MMSTIKISKIFKEIKKLIHTILSTGITILINITTKHRIKRK
jgi:hypothetical protein